MSAKRQQADVDLELIKRSGLFDPEWYSAQHPDVGLSGLDPAEHYLRIGGALRRDPSQKFSVKQYVKQHPDAAKKHENPLLHFLKNGQASVSLVMSGKEVEELRKEIERVVSGLSVERKTPYYRKVLQLAKNCADYRLLDSLYAVLLTIDTERFGQLPPLSGPLVSVIMPVRNRAAIVLEAIESALSQSYRNIEILVCDDASSDETNAVLQRVGDERLRIFRHAERRGAAAARNTCLKEAKGELVAYLDSDNIWHPRYLELMVEELDRWPGHVSAYSNYFDVAVKEDGRTELQAEKGRPFFLEDQLEKPFVDLNSYIHRSSLIGLFGGFDESLERRQDYDLIARYCWVREPRHVPVPLNLYQRIDALDQITSAQRSNAECLERIAKKLDGFYEQGMPVKIPDWIKKVTVVSWDMSRNHFAKAFSVAEALSEHVDVELVTFRFFDEPIFQPLEGKQHKFELKAFQGSNFPQFFDEFAKAAHAITGDVIYCVKPRLSSLGLSLLANFHSGKPVFLEANDLETVVSSPTRKDRHIDLPFDAVFDDLARAACPHDVLWSQVLDRCVKELPVLYTHNINLNLHYGRRALYMRNVKDHKIFDPAVYDRKKIRRELGFGEQDRVILFGGLVRKHKGIFEQVELIKRLNDPRYKLLVVGSRESPDLKAVSAMAGDSVIVLPPQAPEKMAELNLASDLVLLWLDDRVAAPNFQSPYKMSDAFAMGPAIIASPVSDLASFARHGLMWITPFGDQDALIKVIEEVFSDDAERERRRIRARRFFQREFSYNSVPAAFALGVSRLGKSNDVYPVSERFADFFSKFKKAVESAS